MAANVPSSARPFPEVLQERLLAFAAGVCDQMRRTPRDLVSASMIQQLVRSATSVAANYAEARAAQSRRDFIHKMEICLKELRETQIWLRLLGRSGAPGAPDATCALIRECDELTAIFVASVKTAKARRSDRSG